MKFSKIINVGQYNELFHIAENKLQQSWLDMGLTLDDINEMAAKNPDFVKKSKKSGLPPSYYLYKKNANEIVDEILVCLKVEVKD